MRIRHVTFRLLPSMVAKMVESKEAAVAILEATERMEVVVRYAGVPLGEPLKGSQVAVEVTGDGGRRPVLNVKLPAGDLDLALLTFEVVAPNLDLVPLPGFVDVAFEVAPPRRDGNGGWTSAVTAERTYAVVTSGGIGAGQRAEA